MKIAIFVVLLLVASLHFFIWVFSDIYKFFSLNIEFWQFFMSGDRRNRADWIFVIGLVVFCLSALFVKTPDS